jgi:hemoglobin
MCQWDAPFCPIVSACGRPLVPTVDNGRVTLSLPEDQVYAAIGEDGFRRLVASFYRQIPGDSILGPMYPAGDLEGAETRLRQFLVFRFGGPPTYIEQRGHPRLGMRHGPFPINQAARERWIFLMNNAFTEAALPAEAEQTLRDFFEHVATFLINRKET